MLVTRRHHCPLSVSGPKCARNAMACCGVALKAETPLSTMMANTSTLAAMRAMVTRNEGGESVLLRDEARMVCASCWSHAGQLRDEDESPKSRSNSLPHVAHRWRDMG